MIIRKYRNSDFEQMMELQREVLIKENVYRGAGVWEEDLLNIIEYYFNNNGEFIVGLKNDNIISIGGIRKVDALVAELVRMRVHPDFQGKGYGYKILTELEKVAVRKNYKELILETDERLSTAINLYKRNGYLFWKEEELNGCNCIWYKKTLDL